MKDEFLIVDAVCLSNKINANYFRSVCKNFRMAKSDALKELQRAENFVTAQLISLALNIIFCLICLLFLIIGAVFLWSMLDRTKYSHLLDCCGCYILRKLLDRLRLRK